METTTFLIDTTFDASNKVLKPLYIIKILGNRFHELTNFLAEKSTGRTLVHNSDDIRFVRELSGIPLTWSDRTAHESHQLHHGSICGYAHPTGMFSEHRTGRAISIRRRPRRMFVFTQSLLFAVFVHGLRRERRPSRAGI